ncbi:MAG: hypothetical protein K8U03_03445 [Planctomycetia bacterium]|nr:hypothetical protein [Planctomycetia bacterium]
MRRFFVRNRVTISLLLFIALIVEDLIFGTKPNYGWLRNPSLPGVLGFAMVLLGLGVRSWAAGILRKGIDLTTVGPYSLCRNPLYLGSFAVMIGFCLMIGYTHDFVVVCGPILAIYVFTVLNEERRLDEKYPQRWPTYAARTPRQWTKSREYQGLLWTVVGLIGFEVWRLYG